MKKPLLLTLCTLCAICLLWACSSNNPRTVAEKFLDATSHGDYLKAKEFATKASAKSLDMLAAVPNDKQAHPDKIEFVDMNVIDERATYSFMQNDTTRNLSLVKENGEWKVAWSKN